MWDWSSAAEDTDIKSVLRDVVDKLYKLLGVSGLQQGRRVEGQSMETRASEIRAAEVRGQSHRNNSKEQSEIRIKD